MGHPSIGTKLFVRGIFFGLPLLGIILFASLHAQSDVASNTGVAASTKAPAPVVVASYNVENYISMPRMINGHMRTAGKPESEKVTVAKIISEIHPDIIGVMEMGDTRQFNDFQRHLHDIGLDYIYTEYVQGFDPKRHIVLLSQFPIVARNSQSMIPFQINGTTAYSPRGILDVTLQLQPDYQLRVIALHLKSKVNDGPYDSTALREAEAHNLRRYVASILTDHPEVHLLVMGDLNDLKNSPTIFQILGKPEWSDSLQALTLADDRGETWTEYWEKANVYSGIDYMMVSKSLEKSIQRDHSGIARPAFWNEASDHCAIFTTLVPKTEN